MNEQEIQQIIRLEASSKGSVLWRNNVGCLPTGSGQWIRFGLANDSARMNQLIKSSDLIGIQPVLITSEMIGSVFGRFIAREIKKPGWNYRGSPQEKAQDNFMELVNSMGGSACFADSVGTL